jgi:hypothetical protein
MNQNPVGIGAWARPADPYPRATGCGCRNSVGAADTGTLSEMTWVLGIGAVVMLGIGAVVVARSFKQVGF